LHWVRDVTFDEDRSQVRCGNIPQVMAALRNTTIGRSMISSRTKEALARKKSEGKRLGRPKGRLSAVTKLSGKEDLIREYLAKKIPVSVIARLLNVHRLTVRNYIQTRKLQQSSL
jgi:DNA invertase Pin-like site-specific DNA recombinase